ncbi:MAG: dTDP-4-dehydrorhamnose 3,5-epimerase family protein [Longimicrobiales bacterium]|nr:dTDP-4-dehydrorhamnose 3,5-epimerase family protein [Longimicrobiales bacterium]
MHAGGAPGSSLSAAASGTGEAHHRRQRRDLRCRSRPAHGGGTYGRWVGQALDVDTGDMLWVPPGFAHGYCILSETADVLYKVTAPYEPELSRGLRWNDPALGIQWPVTDPILSDADQRQPTLDGCDNSFRITDP